MADLNELEAGQTVKIAGATSSGAETNFVNASANGDLNTANVSNNGGVQGLLLVGTTAIEVKVGASPFSNRKSVTLFNNSNSYIYWGYTSGVTTSNGTPIFKNQMVEWAVGTGTQIFVISASTGNDVRITENA